MTQTVLIIDDEIVLARNLKTYLERAGYAAKTAISAEEGLRQMALFKPKVVIIDYLLPGMDGIQLIAKIHRASPEIKVIMLTAHHNPVLAVNAMRLGASACLAKPLALDRIRAAVEELSDGGPPETLLNDRRQREAGDIPCPADAADRPDPGT